MAEKVLLWPGGTPGALGDGPEDRPELTPYLLEGESPQACVIVCPGGGYARRAPHEGEPIARWLNAVGVAACVLDYRVAPYRHPQPLHDVQRAVRIVRQRAQEWRLDPQRVGVLGFSAGGHLAASAATLFDAGDPAATDAIARQSSRPDAAILCYPVITFGGTFAHSGSCRNLLGEAPDPEDMRKLSLENAVTAQTPPVFLWHTSDDGAVPVENALLFAQALRRHGVKYALHVFPTGRHGLGLAEDQPAVRQWTGLCANWLREIGFAG